MCHRYKGHGAPNTSAAFASLAPTSLWGYLSRRTQPYGERATRNCTDHAWPCIYTGACLVLGPGEATLLFQASSDTAAELAAGPVL